MSFEDVSRVYDTVKALNVEMSAVSWAGFNLFGDAASIKELQRLMGEADRLASLSRIMGGASMARIEAALRTLDYLEAVQDYEPLSASEWLECARDGMSRPD